MVAASARGVQLNKPVAPVSALAIPAEPNLRNVRLFILYLLYRGGDGQEVVAHYGIRIIMYRFVTAQTHLSTGVVVINIAILRIVVLGGEWGLMDRKLCDREVGRYVSYVTVWSCI